MKMEKKPKGKCSSCGKVRVINWQSAIGRYCKRCCNPQKAKPTIITTTA